MSDDAAVIALNSAVLSLNKATSRWEKFLNTTAAGDASAHSSVDRSQEGSFFTKLIKFEVDEVNESLQALRNLWPNPTDENRSAEHTALDAISKATSALKAIAAFSNEINSPACSVNGFGGNPLRTGASVTTFVNQGNAIGLGTSVIPQTQTNSATHTLFNLPKLKLKAFSGDDITQWPLFVQNFNAAIGSQPIEDFIKLQHLKCLLSGRALQYATHLINIASSYATVMASLQDRFGNRSKLVNVLYRQLNTLPNANSTFASIRNTFNECQRIVTQLEALGESVEQLRLTSDILQRFPYKVIEAIYGKAGDISEESAVEVLRQIEIYLFNIETVCNMAGLDFENQIDTSSAPPKAVSAYTVQHPFEANKRNNFTRNSKTFEQKPKLKPCFFCSQNHFSSSCNSFPTLKMRKDKIREMKLCFKCLKNREANHVCSRELTCSKCNGKHPRILCSANQSKSTGTTAIDSTAANNALIYECESDNEDQYNCAITVVQSSSINDGTAVKSVASNDAEADKGTVLLTTSTVIANTDKPSLRSDATIFLDTGSQGTFIDENLARKLSLVELSDKPLRIKPFASASRSIPSKVVALSLRLENGEFERITAHTVPSLTGSLPSAKLITTVTGKRSVLPAAPVSPSLLIGADNLWRFLEAPQIAGSFSIVSTKFGDLVTGKKQDKDGLAINSIAFGEADSGSNDIQKIWSLQNLGVLDDPTSDVSDDKALKSFQENLEYDSTSKQYTAKLPWKTDSPNLSDTRKLAMSRLNSLMRKLQASPEILDQYNQIITNQHEAGIIEKVDTSQESLLAFYIPHHAVVNQNKLVPKPRIVLDASASTRTGDSLNDCLHRGPVFLPNLLGVLLRCRSMKNLLVADIVKAFHQVKLNPDDRDVTRFLWLKDPLKPVTEENLVVYRFTRVVFGMVCSPFMLAATIDHHLRRIGTPLAHEVLRNIYVDNVFIETSSPHDAKQKIDELKELFASASMPLSEFASNDPATLALLRNDENVPEVVKLLGLYWNVNEDTMSIKIPNPPPGRQTKRTVLKHLAKLHDPLGIASPVVVKLKIFLQQLFVKGYGWDEPLANDDQADWEAAIKDWKSTEAISINRHISDSNTTIHVFVDASAIALSAVAYLVQNGKSSFLISKTQVTPAKAVTIPRLELLAMILGVKVLKLIEAEGIKHKGAFLWSDSSCVLGWIRSTRRQSKFVQNRLDTIKKEASHAEFKYVQTFNNPADIGSRGKTPKELVSSQMWWRGPEFISQAESQWPTAPFEASTLDDDTTDVHVSAVSLPTFPIDAHRFSSFNSLIGTTITVLRFITLSLKNKVPQQWACFAKTGAHSRAERKAAERILIRRAQTEMPPTKAQIKNLSLIIGSDGLYYCTGRLGHAEIPCRHPVWIPERSQFTRLFVLHCHKVCLHAGVAHTLSVLRKRFWLCRGRQVVKSVINRHCFGCKRHTSHPFKLPNMPTLNECRVGRSIPFTHCAVDYAGPLQMRRGNEKLSVWIALFCCFATRAVHLELVENLSANTFLLALRRFIGRRNHPKTILSDNATNFTAAAGVVSNNWNAVVHDDKVLSYCSKIGIDWHFTTPSAPWQGGVHERLIGLMKSALKHAIGRKIPTYDEFATFLVETEAVVNSRPLTYVHGDRDDIDVVRPADFLLPNCVIGAPLFDHSDNEGDENYLPPGADTAQQIRKALKNSARCLDRFWKFWSTRYLHQLREQQRLEHKSPRSTTIKSPKLFEVVIVEQNGIDRGQWPLAKVVEIVKRKDNEIKAVVLEFANKSRKIRPISALIPLEVREVDIENDNGNDNDEPQAAVTASMFFL